MTERQPEPVDGAPAVLLINPRMCSPRSRRLPLSLLHLGAVLEGRHPWRIVDGNLDLDPVGTALAVLRERPHAAVGVTVMPGPQVATAIEISLAVRAAFPALPIIWGGYFPTLYPDAAINAPYVDHLVRGQGEATLLDLLARLPGAGAPSPSDSARDPSVLRELPGLTWKLDGRAVHNPERATLAPQGLPPLPYGRLGDLRPYLRPSFMGRRTAVHQAALGCRYRCDFCGVVSMWNGKTVLDDGERIASALRTLRDDFGADAVQFYDHNFFDREASAEPILEALGKLELPWWCYARADTLARFSTATWEKIRRSRLRMAYIGAEAASDEVLGRMKKGTRVEHTVEVAQRCREYGVIPELSFVLGGPEDPEGEIEKTLTFIRRIKGINPDAEIVIYFYSPTPQTDRADLRARPDAAHIPQLRTYGPTGPVMPTTPEEWTEPRWVSWVCHQDAPWLTPRLRQRVTDFARVLACRFPTVQDTHTPDWGKTVLRKLAGWRYTSGRYGRPWELRAAQKIFRLRDPQRESL
ncbi:MAG TPA: radical SAM protein [Polyangia bacterium]|nr:radical SAM protein [Polyangia bacterium]